MEIKVARSTNARMHAWNSSLFLSPLSPFVDSSIAESASAICVNLPFFRGVERVKQPQHNLITGPVTEVGH